MAKPKRRPFYQSALRKKMEREHVEQWKQICRLRELLSRHNMFWAYGPMREAYLNSTIWQDTQKELSL